MTQPAPTILHEIWQLPEIPICAEPPRNLPISAGLIAEDTAELRNQPCPRFAFQNLDPIPPDSGRQL